MVDLRYKRHRYIHELESGPKTTKELAESLGVTRTSVTRIIKILRDEGVVRSIRPGHGEWGNGWTHELVPQ